MKFITLIVIKCLMGVCINPGNKITTVTLSVDTIMSLQDTTYLWQSDGHVSSDGVFIPNKGASKSNGCVVYTKQGFYWLELPCENTIRKLKGCL